MLPGRTTTAAVAGVIEQDTTINSGDLSVFIDAANELVTELCAPATSYTGYRLELIERWLAAHFYAVRDPRALSEGVKGITTAYMTGRQGMILQSTSYGQQAMALDSNGYLSQMSVQVEHGRRRRKLGVLHLGGVPGDSNVDVGYSPFPDSTKVNPDVALEASLGGDLAGGWWW